MGALLVPGVSGRCNEAFLWYGTSMDFINEICREGFSSSRGTGLRFAESVAKSDFHTATECGTEDPKGTRCLILARVLLGETFAKGTDGALPADRPPPCPRNPEADSAVHYKHHSVRTCSPPKVQDGKLDLGRHEYIICDSCQALPIYRVYYHHEAGCTCQFCRVVSSP